MKLIKNKTVKYKSVILLYLLAYSCMTYAQPFLVDKVIARVGSEYILLSEIEDEYSYMAAANPTTTKPEMKCNIIKNLVAQKLIVYQAKLDSVEIKEEEVESQLNYRFESILRQMNGDEAFFKEYYNATVNEMKDRFRDDQRQKILAEKMQAKLIESVKITPAEVQAFYKKIPQDSLPYLSSEVEISELIMSPTVNETEKLKAYNALKDIVDRIGKGEDFATLATKYSMDRESAKKGGDLGFAKRGVFVPEFESAVFSLKEGEMSDIVETEFGYHVMQLIQRKGNVVNARHILISPEITYLDRERTKANLDSIRTLLAKDSMTFEAAVKKFSDKKSQSYSNNGKMKNPNTGDNYFQTKDLDPDTYFAIDKLKPNELSKVLESKNMKGDKIYRIIKLQSKSKPHQANLKQDYDKISSFAKESKKSEYFNTWIQKKMEKTNIIVDPLFFDCEDLNQWIKM